MSSRSDTRRPPISWTNHGRMSVIWTWGGDNAGLVNATRYYTNYYSAKWAQSTGVPASIFSFLITMGGLIVILIVGFVLLMYLG